MKMILVNVALVIIIFLPVALLLKKWDPSIKPYILVAFALAALLIEFITGYVNEKFKEPSVEVNVVRSSETYKIDVESSKPINSVAIDLPILGKIKKFQDMNSIADGTTKIKKIVGSNSPVSQNNIEILIEDLKPSVKLEYTVNIQPLPKSLFIAGTDRYKISYTWQFSGELKTKTKWISLETGKETEKPNVIVKGFTHYNRALSPEEIKKLYEDGLKKHNIND